MAPPTNRPVLVAPDSFKGTLRAAEVAAAIGRGLERAGLVRPTCARSPTAARARWRRCCSALGGETAAARGAPSRSAPRPGGLRAARGRRRRRSSRSRRRSGLRPRRGGRARRRGGVHVRHRRADPRGGRPPARRSSCVGVGGSATTDGGAGAIEAIEEAGGLRRRAARRALRRAHAVRATRRRASARRRARTPRRSSGWSARLERAAGAWPRDPRGVPMTGAAGGLSGGLWAALGAELEPGARVRPRRARLRRAHARGARGHRRRGPARRARRSRARSAGEIATARARPACRATRSSAAPRSTPFERRIIDLQIVREAGTIADAGARGRGPRALGRPLGSGHARVRAVRRDRRRRPQRPRRRALPRPRGRRTTVLERLRPPRRRGRLRAPVPRRRRAAVALRVPRQPAPARDRSTSSGSTCGCCAAAISSYTPATGDGGLLIDTGDAADRRLAGGRDRRPGDGRRLAALLRGHCAARPACFPDADRAAAARAEACARSSATTPLWDALIERPLGETRRAGVRRRPRARRRRSPTGSSARSPTRTTPRCGRTAASCTT